MRALLHNPEYVPVLSGQAGALTELEVVQATALRAVAARLGHNDQLPILLVDDGSLTLLRDLRRDGFTGPLLVMLQRPCAERTAELLYAGADDVLILPVDPRELTARVAAVSRRLRGISAEKISVGDLDFFLDGRHPTLKGQEIRLSAREYDILRHLMLNTNRVVPKEAIYDALYALCAMPPFDKIIDVYICKLRSKMSKARPGGGAYIETVTGRGYRVAAPQPCANLVLA